MMNGTDNIDDITIEDLTNIPSPPVLVDLNSDPIDQDAGSNILTGNKNDRENCLKEIKINSNLDDASIRCDICLHKISTDINQIVLCEGCLVGVHQACYKRDIEKAIPEDDWFCERCRALSRDSGVTGWNNQIKGKLCDDKTGCIVKYGDQDWAHIQCVRWISGVTVNNDSNLIIKIPSKDWEYLGTCCHKGSNAPTVKCLFKGCPYRFHIRCAAKNNILKKDPDMLSAVDIISNSGRLHLFGDSHFKLIKDSGGNTSKINYDSDVEFLKVPCQYTKVMMQSKNNQENKKKRDLKEDKKNVKTTRMSAIKKKIEQTKSPINQFVPNFESKTNKKLTKVRQNNQTSQNLDLDIAHLQRMREKMLKCQADQKDADQNQGRSHIDTMFAPCLPISHPVQNFCSPLVMSSLINSIFSFLMNHPMLQNISTADRAQVQAFGEHFGNSQANATIGSLQSSNMSINENIYDYIPSHTTYIIDNHLDKFLKLKEGTRDEIVAAFINYTAKNGIYDEATQNGVFPKNSAICKVIGSHKVKSKDIFAMLKAYLKADQSSVSKPPNLF